MLKHYAPRLLLALGVLFVSMEIALQVASVVLPAVLLRSGEDDPRASAITILCVGDSHTFGAPLPAADAYPAQLEERLSAANPHRSVRVVNLGIPGQNSAMVANRIDQQIRHYRPDLVIVWVGLNNSWNLNETDLDRLRDPFLLMRHWLLRSKVLRLIVVSRFRDNGAPGRVAKTEAVPTEFGPQHWDLGGEVVEIPSAPEGADMPAVDAIQEQRSSDYARIIDATRNHGVPLIFVAYPGKSFENQRETNLAIREAARSAGAPVVESFDAYMRAVEDGHTNPELIVLAAGPHPTRVLYRYVVDLLMPAVDRLLARSGRGAEPVE